jgi:DNA primase
MGNRRDYSGGFTDSAYNPDQIEAVLREIGVELDGETPNDFIGFCPFHGNRNTPSFSVSRNSGLYVCFNQACAETGNLVQLVKEISKRSDFEAMRLISKFATGGTSLREQVEKRLRKKAEFEEFSQDKIDLMVKTFWEFPDAVTYMVEQRGFEEETLKEFEVGYSSLKNLLAVPFHDPKGMPIGVIGRNFGDDDNKRFINSDRLPKSKTLWNLHRAKKCGESVILVESSFDGMRVHQAGLPNVVACLGGGFSPYHLEQIDRYFSSVVIMTDFDKKEKHFYDKPGRPCRKCFRLGLPLCAGHNPGRDLGANVAAGLKHKNVRWASFEDRLVYPHDAKDAGDMTDDEIRQCVRNSVSNFIYEGWNLY